MPETYQEQDAQTVFALDIGTRSIIGVVGRLENGRVHVLAIEKEIHDRRAMLDGQIEDIDQVAAIARLVMQRLEARLRIRLSRVCVAAAGRALRSERANFTLELPAVQPISDDIIGQLEAGAVSEAERTIMEMPNQQHDRFYMVGYTVAQYLLDGYPMSSLRGHSGKVINTDVVATFLPQEVIESLYAVVSRLDLEVASLTLEPIAALNAAIPADIRLLNLVLVDIGAGTSDIAVCRDGSVVGYTMVTVAGDEVTELLMRKLLVDFQTGERLKMELQKDAAIHYTDILGLSHEIQPGELRDLIQPAVQLLAKEIATRILDLNGKTPSAVFLAGGGSKLVGLRDYVATELKIEQTRVATAGNHFERSAFSDEYTLNDPEYATPLGIAISAALGLINDSYVVTLNGEPAKLFRSGTLLLRDILLMNGCKYADLIGRTGANLTVSLNGERLFFRGEPAKPPEILLNGAPAALSDVIHAGDNIQFTPASNGTDASKTLADLLGEDFHGTMTINGADAFLTDSVHTGDVIFAQEDEREPEPEENVPLPADIAPITNRTQPSVQDGQAVPKNFVALSIQLNGSPLILPPKPNGDPYYLMDLVQYANIDFDHLEKPVELFVNGLPGQFSQVLADDDVVVID